MDYIFHYIGIEYHNGCVVVTAESIAGAISKLPQEVAGSGIDWPIESNRNNNFVVTGISCITDENDIEYDEELLSAANAVCQRE
jgi:hypothetical protein